MIRLPDHDVERVADDHSCKMERRRERTREDEALIRLARDLIHQKIRPDLYREDAASDLARWLRSMLLGPAMPLNKEENFARDVLGSTELVADAEIYFETLHGISTSGLIERNRADVTKRDVYPDPSSPLRVREEVLRNKCVVMVNHFADLRNVHDAILRERAVEHFYDFYLDAITVGHPSSYNSYTGMLAMMNPTFLKRSEDIVLYGLGMTNVPPRGLVACSHAPPPMHTMLVFASTTLVCVWCLPSLESIDEIATIRTFTISVLGGGEGGEGGEGGGGGHHFLSFSPIALALTRLTFALTCAVVTVAKVDRGSQFKVVRLPGSKLPGGVVRMMGWRTQGFYTSWAWNLLGISFLLSGVIPLLVACGREDILHDNPWLLRSALISFEIAAPSAFLTSFIVAHALWPKAYKTHGASGTVGFKGWINLLQHNANSAMVLLEIMLLGGLPVTLNHIVFAILFGLLYIAFLWFMADRWSPGHGPVYPYFFMDTTLGARTTLFMVMLMAVMGIFFALFALLDACMAFIDAQGYGVIPNLLCVAFVSCILMKFRD
jgi:hypothetical protein